MKKILKLVLGLLLVGSMVFGADTSKDFVITTTIPAMAELKIHTESVNTISSFNSVTTATKHEFGSLTNNTDTPATVNSGNYYLAVKTNAKSETYIKALFTVMAGTPLSGNTLDYTLKYNSLETKASTMSTTPIVLFNIPAGSGARVVSNSFSIDILGTDIQTAVPDSYSATITFEYTAS